MVELAKIVYAYRCKTCGDIIYSVQYFWLRCHSGLLNHNIRPLAEHLGKTRDGLYFFCGERRLVGRYYSSSLVTNTRKSRKLARTKTASSRHAKRNRVRRKAVA